MYEKIVKNNPHLKIYRTTDPGFSAYGKRIEDIDTSGFLDAAKNIPCPETGSAYRPSVEEFSRLNESHETAKRIFGQMPTQFGYCWGHSNKMNALEWHKSSEVNIAVTPVVLILGTVFDLKNNTVDSSKLKVFYVEKGEMIEVYATTLHFCPCQTSVNGFGCVVILPEGTNTPLDGVSEDKLLTRKNKWLIAHVDNEKMISNGTVPGVTGENIRIFAGDEKA